MLLHFEIKRYIHTHACKNTGGIKNDQKISRRLMWSEHVPSDFPKEPP